MDEETGSEEEGGGGLDPELIKSYVQFFRHALRAHRLMLGIVLVAGAILTVLVFRYAPRTYTCTTVLMVDASQVLEGNFGSNGLVAAEALILRHDNLETIVNETGLIKKFRARRAPLLALKDRLVAGLVGEPSEEAERSGLIGTLETRIAVKVGTGVLSITVDWGDGQTAAEIAEAARESFVKTRHLAEMSAFEEKLTILDGHATGLRDEIEQLAKQARGLLEQRADNVRAAARAANSAALADAPPPVRMRARTPEGVDLEGPQLKETLDAKRKKLEAFDREHEQRVTEERRKLEELKLRLTPSHPEVATAERRLASIEQEPSEIALLRSEVQSIDTELKQHDVLKRGTSASGNGTRSVAGSAGVTPLDPLPKDIVQLLDTGDIDPALAAQLSSAVSKYAALRDDIRSGRIQFDTAQAAFNYRYKVVVPAEAPKTPTKPKAAVLLGGGLILTILLALVLPILMELRSGIMIERWQVAVTQLPVLAELPLPPSSGEQLSDTPAKVPS